MIGPHAIRRAIEGLKIDPATPLRVLASDKSSHIVAWRKALSHTRPQRQRYGSPNTPGARPYSTGPGHAPTAGYPGVSHWVEERTPGNTVATIQISNPAKMNIVSTSILDQLMRSCQTLSTEDSLRAVVLTGGPTNANKAPSFIGGADIREMDRLRSAADARSFISLVHDACQALRKLPVPVIARVDGFALGAGLEILASCDLRIATRGSVFGMPEVKVGIPSVVEAAYLPGLVGMGRTRRLLYLAENIGASEAERWGLIERVVESAAELDVAVEEWTNVLVGMGPKAIRVQKTLMQKWESCSVEEGVVAGIDAYSEAYADGGKEPHEYMSRFLNRKRDNNNV